MSVDYEAKIKELEAAHKRAETISEINAALSYAEDEEDVLAAIAPFVFEYGATSYSLSYAEDIGEDQLPTTLRTVAMISGDGSTIPLETLPQTRFPFEDLPLNGLAFEDPNAPLFVENAFTDPRLEIGPTREYIKTLNLSAIILLPLHSNHIPRGVIAFNWTEPQVFPPDMRDILTAIRPTVSAVVGSRQTQLWMRDMEAGYRDELEKLVDERTAALEKEIAQRAALQEEVIEAQKQALLELSTPIIPIMDQIIIVPIIGTVDTQRARDITRALLQGITQYRAQTIIIDVTGLPIVDSGVADHLNRTIQAARLKGAHTIITGITDAVAEAVVNLGIDWGDIDTVRDMQHGLMRALQRQGIRLVRHSSG